MKSTKKQPTEFPQVLDNSEIRVWQKLLYGEGGAGGSWLESNSDRILTDFRQWFNDAEKDASKLALQLDLLNQHCAFTSQA
ncbi:MAG: hypothetical protein Q7S31_00435 [bacterium]|nr:hypothetical protein [bacterium]